ncbi:MAG: DUF4058 family protein [Actinomycetota bacterium]
MASPFPGMDPYLEEGSLWMDVHLSLIAAICHELQSLLVPRYYAHLGERSYIEDVRTYELRNREPYLEIRSASSHEVVTVIELLSPANKDVGRGNEEYRRKQEQVLGSQASFVEIDLLRGGAPTAAVTTAALAALPPHDYLAVVHRATARDRGEHYPFTLHDRLPRIGIPLLPGDADAPLDLPAAFLHCYEEGAYQVRVDYRREPPAPPLSAEDGAWLASLLQKAGLRPTM